MTTTCLVYIEGTARAGWRSVGAAVQAPSGHTGCELFCAQCSGRRRGCARRGGGVASDGGGHLAGEGPIDHSVPRKRC